MAFSLYPFPLCLDGHLSTDGSWTTMTRCRCPIHWWWAWNRLRGSFVTWVIQSRRPILVFYIFTYSIYMWFENVALSKEPSEKLGVGIASRSQNFWPFLTTFFGKALPIRGANSAPNGLSCLTRRWCLNILPSSKPSWQKSSTWRYHRYHKESLYLIDIIESYHGFIFGFSIIGHDLGWISEDFTFDPAPGGNPAGGISGAIGADVVRRGGGAAGAMVFDRRVSCMLGCEGNWVCIKGSAGKSCRPSTMVSSTWTWTKGGWKNDETNVTDCHFNVINNH